MKIALRKMGLSLLAATLLAAPALALAYGDGDAAGLRGAAYGLCVAYCEANDCEIQPDRHACDVLRANYAKMTGEDLFPCDNPSPGIN